MLALLDQSEEPSLVLTLRSRALRHHAGQISLPGGVREPGDLSAGDTALRETEEEIGLDRFKVRLIGRLPERKEPLGSGRVQALVGLWAGEAAIGVQDPGEVAAVMRWPIRDLADPVNRVTARHPGGGTGPAWRRGEDFLWGLTAAIVDVLVRLGGWEEPWDRGRIVEVPPAFRRA